MIKFFRHIRRRYLKENRFSKYLPYAIGEILLVVIGILIALQINNWNERKNIRNTEVKLLKELSEDLIKTKEDLLTDLAKSSRILEVTDSLYLKVIESRANNKDLELQISVAYLAETPMLFPKLSAYKSIQAYGVNIISNDSLRNSITDLFELHMERVKFSESFLDKLNESDLRPYFRRVSMPDNDCKECLSLKDQFKTDEKSRQNRFVFSNPEDEFLHMLKQKYNVLRGLKERYLNLDRHIDKMVITINKDIKLNDD
jgi:hypothetical protein